MSMIKIYYQPTGGISFLPEIRDLGEIKVFGCSTPEEYANGAVLFNSTANAPRLLAEEIKSFRPDFVFVESVDAPLLIRALQRARLVYAGPIVGFYGDALISSVTLDTLGRVGRYLNLLLVVDKPAESALRARRVNAEFTLQPAAASIYKYDPSATKVYDIVMTGRPAGIPGTSGTTQRIELARLFSKKSSFAVFGSADWQQYGLKPMGWVDEYQLSKIYNQTKIVLSCDAVIDLQCFTSVRTYNVMCCGAFLLIRKFLGIEDIFTNKKHLVWYETNEEAETLANYYLDHDRERQEIALAGMEYVHQRALKPDLFKVWMCCNSKWEQPSRLVQAGDSFWLLQTMFAYSLVGLVGKLRR
jgi:hypothetical protein